MPELTIAVYGDYIVDRVHRLIQPYRRHTANTVATNLIPGGAGTHVASCLTRCGVTARALGHVGDDSEGRWLTAVLAERGIDISHLRQRGHTGVVTVLVEPGGERTFLIDTVQDARAPTMIDALTPAAIAGVDAVHVSGHTLIRDSQTRGAAEHIAKLRTAGLSTAIELPDPPTLAAFGVDHFHHVIDSAGFDLIFANAAEAAALGVGQSWTPRKGTCVVTAGGQPVTISSRHATVTIPVAPVTKRVIDTTGAGDVFAAAFFATWLTYHDPAAAVATAHREATRLISGAVPHVCGGFEVETGTTEPSGR